MWFPPHTRSNNSFYPTWPKHCLHDVHCILYMPRVKLSTAVRVTFFQQHLCSLHSSFETRFVESDLGLSCQPILPPVTLVNLKADIKYLHLTWTCSMETQGVWVHVQISAGGCGLQLAAWQNEKVICVYCELFFYLYCAVIAFARALEQQILPMKCD